MSSRLSSTRQRTARPGNRTGPPRQQPQQYHPSGRVTVSLATTCCGLLYAAYRGYYGLGGTAGMIGRPADQAQWRAVNLAGAAILLVLALLPAAALPLWPRRRLKPVLLAVCRALAVGYITPGLINDIQRVLDLAGLVHMRYPAFWATVNARTADIQDLAFNETWFLAEGLLWGALGVIGLGRSPGRRWRAGSACAAIAVVTSIGLLSAFGVIGKIIVF